MPRRIQRGDLGGQPRQGLGRVVGRQQLAARGVGRALLQVQVGDHQGAARPPATARPGGRSRTASPARRSAHRAAVAGRDVEGELRAGAAHAIASSIRAVSEADSASSPTRRRASARGRSPAASAPRRATAWSGRSCRIRPLIRASSSPSRARSIRPARRVGPGAAQQQVVRLVAAQHVVDQVGGEGDLAAGLLLAGKPPLDQARRSGRTGLKARLHHRALRQPGFQVVAQHVLRNSSPMSRPSIGSSDQTAHGVVVGRRSPAARRPAAPAGGSAAWPGWCAPAAPRTDRRP